MIFASAITNGEVLCNSLVKLIQMSTDYNTALIHPEQIQLLAQDLGKRESSKKYVKQG
jgi:hypothetical protein